MSARTSVLRRTYDATYGRLFAALYERSLAKAEQRSLAAARARLLAGARGRTLELGAGTGLNLPHYGPTVTELVLCEPFEPMARRLRLRAGEQERPATVVEAPAEALPFPDESFDTVVSTLVLCTVEDPGSALAESARVLRPGGALMALEHVRAEGGALARAQDLLRGPWRLIGHGCRPNRDTGSALLGSRLEVEHLERTALDGMVPLIRPGITAVARKARAPANG